MGKTCIYLFIFLGLSVELFAQKTESSLNEEFVKKQFRIKSHGDTLPTGYIPFPNRLIFGKNTREKSSLDLPSTYDLRTLGFVTSVKNQGSGVYGGNCWAFAQMGAIESRWLKLGAGSFDLSEQNMVSCHGFNSGYGEGGNDMMAFSYLGRFSGPLSETSDPYNTSKHSCVSGLPAVAYVPDIQFLDGNSLETIKTYLMQYGGLSISMYWDNKSYTGSTGRYPYTYYYSGDSSLNHQVLIIGWDDAKHTAGGTGAWLVKNSWGATWGQNGYFYLAYQDTRALSTVSFNPTRLATSQISKVFMNDLLGPVGSIGFNNTIGYALVKYKATSGTHMHKIGTFVESTNSIVSATIYKTFKDQVLSDSITSIAPQVLKNPGFYLFDTKFVTDTVFYVKVKYISPYTNNPIPVEKRIYSDATTIYADPVVLSVGSQWLSGDGIHWEDCGKEAADYVANLSIRAYAGSVSKPVAGFSVDKKNVCIGNKVFFKDLSDREINTYLWDFGDGATPRTSMSSGVQEVSYSSAGLKDVSLIVSGPAGQDTIVKSGFLEVVNTLSLITSVDSVGLELGKSLRVEVYGADNYQWTPNYQVSSDTGRVVFLSPVKDTTYTVTGIQGSCQATKKVKFTVAPKPGNDDVCNAFELKMGYNGLYTNLMATVQKGEPAPKEGDCNTPLQWCIEGGLQNSVWFYFIPGKTTTYSFISDGMDTQMAVYEADTCVGILSGKGTLIAANDDYFSTAPYAAAINKLSMTAGKKYWIQVDGSGGGVTGKFSITVITGGVGITTASEKDEVRLYPNPSTGSYHLSLPENIHQPVIVMMFDITGRIVYSQTVFENYEDITVEPGNLGEGIYLVHVFNSDVNQLLKLVIKK